MDPVAATPTEPRDYAALNGLYALALAGVAGAVRRAPERAPAPGEWPLLGAATFALAKLVTREKVTTWMREPFVEEDRDGERRPRGRRARYALGELLTCSRCMGSWSALALVALRVAQPDAGRTVAGVLAASAANDFLQTGFAATRALADAAESASARGGGWCADTRGVGNERSGQASGRQHREERLR